MVDFISQEKTIPHAIANVYAALSDLRNIQLVKGMIPADKLKNLAFDKDSCTLNVSPIGNVRFVVVERVANQSIKLAGEKLPFAVNMSILLAPLGDNETQLKLHVEAKLNVLLKTMVGKALQDGVEDAASILSTLAYDEIANKEG